MNPWIKTTGKHHIEMSDSVFDGEVSFGEVARALYVQGEN